MKKACFLLLALMTLMSTPSCAQRNATSDYKYLKAIEAYRDEDDAAKALELLNEMLDEAPNHFDSRFLRAKIFWGAEKYDNALRDVNYAIKKYKGKPSVYKSTLYGLRGAIYDDMERYSEAAKDYQMAAKLAKKDNPERVQSYMFDYAQSLYNADDLAGAENVYFQMLKIDEGDVAAMVGLARNKLNREEFEDGLEWLNKAETYDASYAEIYRFKMQILDKLGKTDESVEAALKHFELDDDAPAWFVSEYVGKHYTYGIARVKAEMNKDNASNRWIVLLTRLYEDHSDYVKALELYEKVEKEYGENKMIAYYKSNCYSELGQFNMAIKDATRAIDLDGSKTFYGRRGDIYRSAGMYDKAIADYTVSMEDDPSGGYEYYAIGWCYELQGNKDKALEYYNQGIDMDKTYAYLFVSRGDLLKGRGDIEGANADYEKVLEIDTDPDDGSCRQYALLGLGRDDEALEWMEKIIENNPYDNGIYYDKACLLARMSRTGAALEALKTAFEKGYRRFAHLEHDDDMDPLRNLPEYKALIRQYKGKPVVAAPEEVVVSPEAAETLISEVQMKKMAGGTYEVPCSINGLPLKFIFDTGASDVTISSVEANFMLKNDYLSTKDFKGNRKYLTADGNISEGAVICIREVQVGDVKLKNIDASVVKNQKAPLLLGQSVLEKFGSITIDNNSGKLIIKHQ